MLDLDKNFVSALAGTMRMICTGSMQGPGTSEGFVKQTMRVDFISPPPLIRLVNYGDVHQGRPWIKQLSQGGDHNCACAKKILGHLLPPPP